MSGRPLNAGGRVDLRRTRAIPDPHGNRAQRRAWARERRAAQNGPQAAQPANPDREARDGQTAAHGPAGRHDGRSTDGSDEPECQHCGMAGGVHTPDCDWTAGITAAYAQIDAIRTERTTP